MIKKSKVVLREELKEELKEEPREELKEEPKEEQKDLLRLSDKPPNSLNQWVFP